MISFEVVFENDKKMKIMTGICLEEFSSILDEFSSELDIIRNPKESRSGAPSKLTLKEKLLMSLIHYRHYQGFDFIGVIFNVDGSTVKRWFDSCEIALEAVLEKKSLSHLIPRNQDLSLKPSLDTRKKSILMGLNNLSEDLRIKRSKKTTIQVKRNVIHQKS